MKPASTSLPTPAVPASLEAHFEPFRRGIIGYDATFETPYGRRRLVYADWIASGRLYAPIERRITEVFGPMVGNTHSESSVTGTTMTRAYHHARQLIKRHVNAGPDDVIITAATGMTGVVNKLQRILGLRLPERFHDRIALRDEERPVVFITHMEHHSNQTSWLETIADVVQLPANDEGLVDLDHMHEMLARYADRPLKIGSFTSASNVTGIHTPYHRMARIMHEHDGYCFVDFAASAPYIDIDMHPPDPMEKLDAIFFSPHKFLGGPGACGVLVFDRALYHNRVPDNPGGGTVMWTNPWGEHSYIPDIELREDGGTPGFLQAIRAALAIQVKEQMGAEAMRAREEELLAEAFPRLRAIPGVHLLADAIEDRLGILSFYVENLHYNLVVRLLNDRYGIQVRGGCSCAGTYGHFLLHVDRAMSHAITERIDRGDLSLKPGWVRLSLHPTMTDAELDFVLTAIAEVVEHGEVWGRDYRYDPHTNEFIHRTAPAEPDVRRWFFSPEP
ncbi:selenocysteine lyase [Rhodothermaceae bacterium RA]|nr:selenocysteine lyase [Rhodothermaceae bacterium RA]